MEVQRVSDRSFKIKSKNATFIVDPTGNSEGDILVFTTAPSGYSQASSGLVISGPGEYEVSGVSIKGDKHKDKISYDFLEENQKVLIATASSIGEIKELVEYTAIIVIADQALEEKLGEIAADIIILVSAEEFLPADTSSFKKIDKINLKKTEEFKGFVIHLSK